MARETHYRRYVIRSMKINSEWSARAFRGKVAVGGICTASTEEEAILKVKTLLDALHSEQLAKRAPDGFPTADEVRAALAAIKMNDAQSAMLRAHLLAPGNILTATELAEAGGYDSYAVANSQYGALGRKLAEELDWHPPIFNGVPTWTFALATGADGNVRAESLEMGHEHWRWKLRPQVADALQG